MKEETKELINWIKHQINLSGECLVAQPNEYWKEDKEKAFQFLDSLPNIEEKLCLGGYIQDKNGTPCCHGDKVKFQYGERFYYGTLTWNFTFRCFTIVSRDCSYFWVNGAMMIQFEKIEIEKGESK